MKDRLSLSACFLGLTLFLVAGCAVAPQNVAQTAVDYRDRFAYQPERSPAPIDASATVEASASLTPETRALWRKWFANDQMIEACLTAMAGALTNDLAGSGLFSRIQQPGNGKPDYTLRIQCEESNPTNLQLRVRLQVLDPTTGQEIYTRTETASLEISGEPSGNLNTVNTPNFPPDVGAGWSGTCLLIGSIRTALQAKMPVLKSDFAAFLSKQPAALKAAEAMQNAPLPDLLVANDSSVSMARARNHAIISAKNHQLPAIIRERKTDELTELVVKIEQTLLDLNHECEVSKDKAQQVTATNGDARQIDEPRGLAICYRERIELLKPILSALKEEIANRNR